MLSGPRQPGFSRRRFIETGLAGLGLPLLVGAGCTEISGEHQIDTYFILKPGASGAFSGWTEIQLEQAAPNAVATLKRASITAPMGLDDLTFLTNILGQVRDPASGGLIPLVSQTKFPKNDTIGLFDILYHDDIRPFFKDDTVFRVEWSGMVDTTGLTLPAEGARVDILVTVDVGAVSEA